MKLKILILIILSGLGFQAGLSALVCGCVNRNGCTPKKSPTTPTAINANMAGEACRAVCVGSQQWNGRYDNNNDIVKVCNE